MHCERFDVTAQDLRIIENLLAAGYGWAKFALSVQQQGWISKRQQDTLCEMSNKLSCNRLLAGRRFKTASRSKRLGYNDNFEQIDYGGVGEYF